MTDKNGYLPKSYCWNVVDERSIYSQKDNENYLRKNMLVQYTLNKPEITHYQQGCKQRKTETKRQLN